MEQEQFAQIMEELAEIKRRIANLKGRPLKNNDEIDTIRSNDHCTHHFEDTIMGRVCMLCGDSK